MTVTPAPLRPGKAACMLVYGIAGCGKTTLVGTGSDTLIIRPPTDHTDSILDPAGVKEVVVEDHAQLDEVFQWGQQGEFKNYKWVWLDGISLLEDHGLDDVFQAAVDRRPERAMYGPDKGEYGINRSRLTTWLRNMVGLSKMGQFNFGVTANVMEWHDPVTEADIWTPMFGSAKSPLSAKLCGMMNIVAYLQEVRKEEDAGQRLLLADAAGFVGKDQYHCFPKLKSGRHGFINPTMQDVEAAIAKARKPTRARARRSSPARRKRARK